MDYDCIHYLDTSVLVKLLVKEDGSDVMDDYMARSHISAFSVTSLCFVEALRILKRKNNPKQIGKKTYIDKEQYFATCDELRGRVSDTGDMTLEVVDVVDSDVFDEAESIARECNIDMIDAYQIVTLSNNFFLNQNSLKMHGHSLSLQIRVWLKRLY